MTCDLRLGDCLDPASGLSSFDPLSIDHVITDPPYASEIYQRCRKNPGRYDGSASVSLAKLSRNEIGNCDALVLPVAAQIARVTRRWAIVFCDVENLHRWRLALVSFGMRFMRTGAWVKPNAMPQFSGDRPAMGFEACVIVHSSAKARWNGGGHAAVWTHGVVRGKARRGHPCPKPEPLMADLVRLFTSPGDLVCDPFSGVGSTAAATIRQGRRFVGWEMNAIHHASASAYLRAVGAEASRKESTHGSPVPSLVGAAPADTQQNQTQPEDPPTAMEPSAVAAAPSVSAGGGVDSL